MIALDSSVIVAAVLAWHERHDNSARAVAHALNSNEDVIIPAHSLVESYSVLTRLPPPYRLSGADALELLRENFGGIRLVSLASRDLWPLLSRLGKAGIGGGVTYDALILESARSGGATRILTLNARDYERFDVGVEIVEPK